MRILLTNDDGIEAPGIQALIEVFTGSDFELIVVAPDSERSGASHSVTLKEPLYIDDRGHDRFAVSGTPVDCVHLAVNHILKDRRPDLIVSGINAGANLACDVHYSGTAGAAREGTMLGVPSIAISLLGMAETLDFGPAARFARAFAQDLANTAMPERTFINVNFPDLSDEQIKGVKVTTQGIRIYSTEIRSERDERGDMGYAFAGVPEGGQMIPDSDIVAVESGYVSVTPLRLDATNATALDWLRACLDHGGPSGRG